MNYYFLDIAFSKIVIISILLTHGICDLSNIFENIKFKKRIKRTVDKYYIFGEKRQNKSKILIDGMWFSLHIFSSIYIYIWL